MYAQKANVHNAPALYIVAIVSKYNRMYEFWRIYSHEQAKV